MRTLDQAFSVVVGRHTAERGGFSDTFTAPLSARHPAAARRYTYDEENRLTAVGRPNPNDPGGDPISLLEIEYDALGRRVLTKEHVGGCGTGFQPVKTRHVYAGIEVLEDHACCDGEEAGGLPACPPAEGGAWALAREFLWGERFPEPLAMIDYTDAGDVPAIGSSGGGAETLHFVHDALGSVIGLLDAGDPDATPTPIPPKMVERYEYDPYGRTYVEAWDAGTSEWVRLTPQGDATAGGSRFGNPFAWTGQRYDASVGMYHFLFRSYSPELGRWMQRDPLGYLDGVNLYEYVRSCATTATDPMGAQQRDWTGSWDPPTNTTTTNIGTEALLELIWAATEANRQLTEAEWKRFLELIRSLESLDIDSTFARWSPDTQQRYTRKWYSKNIERYGIEQYKEIQKLLKKIWPKKGKEGPTWPLCCFAQYSVCKNIQQCAPHCCRAHMDACLSGGDNACHGSTNPPPGCPPASKCFTLCIN
ncbi:hypothetical protein RAS1_14720 [Phycisphaerae bacterium RAS1]|nr:hypothetical protein RAS1_14720 [Phycisphaerae bacterium RAS1]